MKGDYIDQVGRVVLYTLGVAALVVLLIVLGIAAVLA